MPPPIFFFALKNSWRTEGEAITTKRWNNFVEASFTRCIIHVSLINVESFENAESSLFLFNYQKRKGTCNDEGFFLFLLSLSLKRDQPIRSVPFRGKRKGRNICCGNAHTYKKGTSAGLNRMRQNLGPLKKKYLSEKEGNIMRQPPTDCTHKSIGPLKKNSQKNLQIKTIKLRIAWTFSIDKVFGPIRVVLLCHILFWLEPIFVLSPPLLYSEQHRPKSR